MSDAAPPTEEQPKPAADPKETEQERKARVNRDNAFMDLVKLMEKNMGPALSLCGIDAELYDADGKQVRGKVILHADPGQVSQAIMALSIQLKQMELGFNAFLSMYLKEHPEQRQRFYEISAAAAEQTVTLIRRQILSQGAQPRGIVKPS